MSQTREPRKIQDSFGEGHRALPGACLVANIFWHPREGTALPFFSLLRKVPVSPCCQPQASLSRPRVAGTTFFGSSPPPFGSPFLSALGGRKILYLRPIPPMPSRARAPTRAPSVHLIGHLHLYRVTGSFKGLLQKEAEAAGPSQSCFVRGSLAAPGSPRPLRLPAVSPDCAARAWWEGFPERGLPASL